MNEEAMEERNNKEKIQILVISKKDTHNVYLYSKIVFVTCSLFIKNAQNIYKY